MTTQSQADSLAAEIKRLAAAYGCASSLGGGGTAMGSILQTSRALSEAIDRLRDLAASAVSADAGAAPQPERAGTVPPELRKIFDQLEFDVCCARISAMALFTRMRDLCLAYVSPVAAQASVPAGYVLVPEDPTHDMLTAAGKVDDAAFCDGRAHGATPEDLWYAMLAAAAQAATKQEE